MTIDIQIMYQVPDLYMYPFEVGSHGVANKALQEKVVGN